MDDPRYDELFQVAINIVETVPIRCKESSFAVT